MAQNNQELLPLLSVDPREAYRRIRNFLAGRLVGATRDEALVEEVVKCLFCRAHQVQEGTKRSSDAVKLAHQYRATFAELKPLLPSIFAPGAEILLDPVSLQYVDAQFASIDFNDPTSDPIGDAYEAFIGSAARGSEGQFFTPQNAVGLLVSMVQPEPGERIIDPACGAGGFLSHAARHLLSRGASRDKIGQWIFGIDKDRYLATLASAHIAMLTLTLPSVYCADSLAWLPEGGGKFDLSDQLGTFDVVLTNPPFGAKIVSVSEEIQRRFELGYKWTRSDNNKNFLRSQILASSVPPQILFVERCLSLVRPGGRIGMVVPESLISGKSYRHVVNFMMEHAHIRAVIGMPESLFKTSGKGGTHTKTCLVFMEKRAHSSRPNGKTERIFMAEVKWCGRDSRGRNVGPDELPEVGKCFQQLKSGKLEQGNHLGYAIASTEIADFILAPRAYNPDVDEELERLASTHKLVTVRQLVDSGALEIKTGNEIGKLAYGSGSIPFVRTSDISNWEIKIDPKHGVSDEVYALFAGKQDVREGDILMVRDGSYLIGTCAYVTNYDTRILYQSHLYKLRVLKPTELSPFLLLAILSSAPLQKQIKAKRQTQDIIDSLGDRIYELVLPIPQDMKLRERVTAMVERCIHDRIEAREFARQACVDVVGAIQLSN